MPSRALGCPGVCRSSALRTVWDGFKAVPKNLLIFTPCVLDALHHRPFPEKGSESIAAFDFSIIIRLADRLTAPALNAGRGLQNIEARASAVTQSLQAMQSTAALGAGFALSPSAVCP